MNDFFNNFSYNNYTPQFIGKPIEEYKALHELNQKQYDYVQDKELQLQDALSKIKYLDVSKDVYLNAKAKLDELINLYNEEGNLEDKVVDINKFSLDLMNKHGLKAVQDQYNSREAFIKSAQENKDLHPDDISKAVSYLDKYSSSVKYDDVTGTWSNTGYGNINIPVKDYYDEWLIKILNGWNPDTNVYSDTGGLVTEDGKVIIKDRDGYFTTIDHERVDPQEVYTAARRMLLNNQDFNQRINFDVTTSKGNLKNEDGTLREYNMQDIKNIVPEEELNKVLQTLGVNSVEELEKKGINAESLFKQIYTEKKINDFVQPVVAKESYDKFKADWLKDWILEKELSNSREGQEKYDTYEDEETTIPVYQYGFMEDNGMETYLSALENVNTIKKEISDLDFELSKAEKIFEKEDKLPEDKKTMSTASLEELRTKAENKQKELLNVEYQIENIKHKFRDIAYSKANLDFDNLYDAYSKEYMSKLNSSALNAYNSMTMITGGGVFKDKVRRINRDSLNKFKELGFNVEVKDGGYNSKIYPVAPTFEEFKKAYSKGYTKNMIDSSTLETKIIEQILKHKQNNNNWYTPDKITPFSANISGISNNGEFAKMLTKLYNNVSKEEDFKSTYAVNAINTEAMSSKNAKFKDFKEFIGGQLLVNTNAFQSVDGLPLNEAIDNLKGLDFNDEFDSETSYKNVLLGLERHNDKPVYILPLYKFTDKEHKHSQKVGDIRVTYNGLQGDQEKVINDLVLDVAKKTFMNKAITGNLSAYDEYNINKLGMAYVDSRDDIRSSINELRLSSMSRGTSKSFTIHPDSNTSLNFEVKAVQNSNNPNDINFVLRHDGIVDARNNVLGKKLAVTLDEFNKLRANDDRWYEAEYENSFELKSVLGSNLLFKELEARENSKRIPRKKKISNSNNTNINNGNIQVNPNNPISFKKVYGNITTQFKTTNNNLDYNRYIFYTKASKDGMQKVNKRLIRYLNAFDNTLKSLGYNEKIQINSSTDGDHDANTHAQGRALDIQIDNDYKMLEALGVNRNQNWGKYNILMKDKDFTLAYEPPTIPNGKGHFHLMINNK